MNGVLLVPTLNRIELLKRFIKSYVEMGSRVKTLLLVDDDDLKKNAEDYGALDLPLTVEVVNTGSNVMMGDKVRYIWPQIETYEWVGLLNDDHVIQTPEWDEKVEAYLDGTNFVSSNDGFWNFGINPVGITAWSMPLLRACGFAIFPNRLHHWFVDDLWKAIGESTGCWHETMKINVAHKHVYKGEMAPDDTHRLIQNQEQITYAQKEFQHFMEQDFKSVCMKIMELRKNHQLKAKFS